MGNNNRFVERIVALLRDRFGIDSHVQCMPVKNESRSLYLIEAVKVSPRTTVAGVHRRCKRIAKALGGELYGTVNLDYISQDGKITFEMMVETNQ